jgi:hypothetical protein
MKFLYTDDRSGKFSSTTLRTWLCFALFFFYATALAIGSFAGLNISSAQLDLLGLLGMVFGAGGMLYMGKRINESRTRLPRLREPDDFLNEPRHSAVDSRQL